MCFDGTFWGIFLLPTSRNNFCQKQVIITLDITKQSQPQVQKQLIDFFNGQVGLLNKCKHDVEILDNLLGNSFRKPNRTDIISNLHIIKESLEQINDLELRQNMRQTIDLIIRRRGLNEMKSGMDILKSYLQKKVNEETLAYLDGNKILQKYIK